MKILAVLLFAIALTACSGSKPDKDLPFSAIFRVAPDSDVVVHRAKIWENRHLLLFHEFYALAEFEASEEKVAALLSATKKKFSAFDATDFGFGLKDDEAWFAPRDGSKYVGWRSEDGIYVVRSSTTKRMFAYRAEL